MSRQEFRLFVVSFIFYVFFHTQNSRRSNGVDTAPVISLISMINEELEWHLYASCRFLV